MYVGGNARVHRVHHNLYLGDGIMHGSKSILVKKVLLCELHLTMLVNYLVVKSLQLVWHAIQLIMQISMG